MEHYWWRLEDEGSWLAQLEVKITVSRRVHVCASFYEVCTITFVNFAFVFYQSSGGTLCVITSQTKEAMTLLKIYEEVYLI